MADASAPATTIRPATVDSSTDASIRNGYRFTSPAMKIGKTFWRYVVLPSRHGAGPVTDYEWLNTEYSDTGIWYPSDQRRGYDHNDGMYAGLPKTLRKLWELHHHEYEKLNCPGRSNRMADDLNDHAYQRIDPTHPMFNFVQQSKQAGNWACDALDHDDNCGCSNPHCFKFHK